MKMTHANKKRDHFGWVIAGLIGMGLLICYFIFSAVDKWDLDSPAPASRNKPAPASTPGNDTPGTSHAAPSSAHKKGTIVSPIDPASKRYASLNFETRAELGLGPQISAYLELPTWANRDLLEVRLNGNIQPAHDGLTYIIPKDASVSNVCYGGYREQVCMKMRLLPGSNPVPLTMLEVTRPEYYALDCELSGRTDSFSSIGNRHIYLQDDRTPSSVERLVIIPGEYLLSCNISAKYPDHASESVGSLSATGVTAAILAPSSGGVVRVTYEVRGYRVQARTSTDKY